MKTWYANACGNTFLVVEGSGSLSYINNLRNLEWSFDSALVLEPTDMDASVSMRVLEQDGSESDMCGNGLRVIGKILHSSGRKPIVFAGGVIHQVEIINSDQLRTTFHDVCRGKMKELFHPSGERVIAFEYRVSQEPHMVCLVNNIHHYDLMYLGKQTVPFANCTVISVESRNRIHARTYERGVNRITKSCGTGAASALKFAYDLGLVAHGQVDIVMGRNLLYGTVTEKQVSLIAGADFSEMR